MLQMDLFLFGGKSILVDSPGMAFEDDLGQDWICVILFRIGRNIVDRHGFVYRSKSKLNILNCVSTYHTQASGLAVWFK